MNSALELTGSIQMSYAPPDGETDDRDDHNGQR